MILEVVGSMLAFPWGGGEAGALGLERVPSGIVRKIE